MQEELKLTDSENIPEELVDSKTQSKKTSVSQFFTKPEYLFANEKGKDFPQDTSSLSYEDKKLTELDAIEFSDHESIDEWIA